MSLANLLVPNNYHLQMGSLEFSGQGPQSELSEYSTGQINIQFSGAIIGAPNIEYTKVGTNVTLTFMGLNNTAEAPETILSTTPIPSFLWPIQDNNFVVSVIDNSANVLGIFQVLADGFINIGVGLGVGVFTNSGTAGYANVSFSYISAS